MSEANVTIKMAGHGCGEIFLNGVKVPNVTDFAILAGVGCPNQLKLVLTPKTIEVDGVFDVTSIEGQMREHKAGHED